jgi:ATP-dependent Clp protease ATP-binding subunit ClpC
MIVAQQVTRGLGHEEIGAVELLVARATKAFASGQILIHLGVSPEDVYAATDRAVTTGSVAHLTHRPMATDTKKAILQTGKEADQLGDTVIGTEHLLLGVLRERKSVGGKVLMELGVTYDAALGVIAEPRPDL